ncbi:MAG: hypothetical protein ACKVZH_03310, partial [Blastocatellia bacterium]
VSFELNWRPTLRGGFENQDTHGLPTQGRVQNTAVGQQKEHTRHTKETRREEFFRQDLRDSSG